MLGHNSGMAHFVCGCVVKTFPYRKTIKAVSLGVYFKIIKKYVCVEHGVTLSGGGF